jgi:branched-chain amino acid transport system substrate-binding protein
MNKSYVITGAILLVILIGSWAITNKSAAPTEGVVKVGVIAPLTGPLAEYGEAFRNGIVLAQEQSPNKNVQYIFEDSAYDSGKTVTAFYKLRDTDKVDVLINWGDPTSLALATVVKDSGIPFIAATTLSDVAKASPDTVRTLDTADDFAKVMWSYFRTHGQKNIGIVKLEHPYINNLVAALTKEKKADEKVEVIDTYQSFGDKDFRTSIVKIKTAAGKYDTVGVFLGTGQIGQYYNQAAQLGLKKPSFGTDFFESQSDIDTAGKNIDGAVYANYDVTANFKSQYQTKFGNVSQIGYAGNGYDIASLLNKEIKLKQVKNYSGVLGLYNYIETSGDRYLYSPVHMKLIENGVIKTIN